MMFGFEFGCDRFGFGSECCCCWNSEELEWFDYSEPQRFSLPSPIPTWPQGQGFGDGRISLGEIEVAQISKFENIWSFRLSRKSKRVSFFKPVDIPEGFFCLGYYSQPNDQPLNGYVLVATEATSRQREAGCIRTVDSPALKKPIRYSLIWSSDSQSDGCGYFWMPNPPEGYRAMGFVVTSKPEEPSVDEVRCVREDLTETCETSDIIFSVNSKSYDNPFWVWSTIPCERGMWCQGVPVGTFFCSSYSNMEDAKIVCLKNVNSNLHGMPNLDQVHALIQHYGPTLFFHPDETYLSSSVQWFFNNGAVLCRGDSEKSEPILYGGSNLPAGGENDGNFWIDLPAGDKAKDRIKCGDMESSELYVHVKPALGGTFTDIAMWVFCPFNGPSTIKVGGFLTIPLNKIGEHIGDWEHYTLRVSNFTGELSQIYFSEHSGGRWVDAYDLEFISGNKAVIYASKYGHASFPHPGTYIEGSSKLGIGVTNEVDRSNNFIDSSTRYQIIAAEYLGDGAVTEPCWLQYMREWGPTIVYDSRSEIDKLLDLLPVYFRFSVENLIDLFPTALYGEEGPTGPKEKDNWEGDER